MTGTTVVRRESEWDDTERAYALELDTWESGLCTCGCGLPRAIAHDPEQAFLIDKDICYAARQIERQRRVEQEEAKKLNKPDGWDDGMHYIASPISHDEAQRILAEQSAAARERRQSRERSARGRAHGRHPSQG